MKTTSLYGLIALGFLSTACTSDTLGDDPGTQESQDNKTLYVNMNIRGDIEDSSRAGESNPTFDKGDGESNVKNAYFVFYDASGSLVGDIVKIDLPSPTEVTDATGSVEKYYQSVVPVSIHHGENNPTQVVCYINPITPASLQNSLDKIQTNTRDILYITDTDGKKYFAMSNSVYYPDEGVGKMPRIAVPVAPEQLFNSEAAAKAALENASAVVDIYVERYASKIKFSHTNADPYKAATSPILSNAETEVILKFVPKCWTVNATCKATYIVKSFRQEANDGQVLPDNYTYDALNNRINASKFTAFGDNINYDPVLGTDESWIWNNPALRRSFWGMSPAYFTKEYPEVSSDVTGELNNSLDQTYFTYNQLLGENGVGIKHEDTPVAHYFNETTVGARGLKSKNPAASVPSVILVGDYTVEMGGKDLNAGTTFYTYMTNKEGTPLVYFKNDPTNNQGKSVIDGGESMLRRFIEMTSVLFKKSGSNYVRFDISNENDMKTLVAALEVGIPTRKEGGKKIPERYRTLKFKAGGDKTGIYVVTSDGYNSIGTANDAANHVISVESANEILMDQVGCSCEYNSGAAYFNIPIKHLGWYRPGNTQKNEAKIDWNIVRVGDFGIVRNHSYDIKVEKIIGLGTGIGGKDNPIVPPAVSKDYYVAYRVNVLKWAVVPQQKVDL